MTVADEQSEMWVESDGHTLRVESAGPREFFFRWMLDLHRPAVSEDDTGPRDTWSPVRDDLLRVGLSPRETRARWVLDALNIPEQSNLETWVTFRGPSAKPEAFTYGLTDSFHPAPSDPCGEDRGYAVVCLGACEYLPVRTP